MPLSSTGAYGGNRVLMALLQMLAAWMAGVDVFVAHTFERKFTEAWHEARTLLSAMRPGMATRDAIDLIVAQKFEWGFSDGN